MENEEFIKEFGELCKRAAINNIEKMEYVNDGLFENVIVTYKNGYTKEIDVRWDSQKAMIVDIIKQGGLS